jgi:hypothetical protein
MPHLVFDCLDAGPLKFAAAPTLAFRIRIAETAGDPVHAIALRCQIRIDPRKRRYSPDEAAKLTELFGTPDRWGETLKPIQFAIVPAMVPGFTGSTELELAVPCSYDLEVASGKLFSALGDGDIPMVLLFNGTVFSKGTTGFSVQQIPWESECEHRLPVQVWRELMDLYFPGEGWLRVGRDVLGRLQRYKAAQAHPTWDGALDALLKEAGG